MSDWVTETGIPCFRPHVRRDDAGAELYTITAADLAEIARNSNRFTIELHGAKPPLTEGHRNFAPDADEKDQPLVMGYAENFRVGTLPDGTPCILCDRQIMAQYEARAKRHPFPSVDYIHSRKAIVGLAKLTRPPALNTGAVYYPGTKDAVYVYSMGGSSMADAPGGQQAGAAATPQMTPEEMAGCQKVETYLFGKHPWMKAQADKYAADLAGGGGASAPSGTNTAVPKEGETKKKDEVTSNAANAELVQKYNAQQSQLATLIEEREGDKVDAILNQLEHVERYQFERPEERTRMLGLTQPERLKRADEIRKYHHKLPGGDRVDIYSGDATPGGKQQTSREMSDRAVQLASEKGISYDAALVEVRSGK